MYVNSPGAESGSYSLTFLGKKVGRHRSVAPAGKQFAWETTVRSSCPEDRVVSPRVAKVPVAAQELEELPGSVPELQDERPCPIIHNTQLDQYEKTTAGVSGRKVTATRPHSCTRNQRGERVGWVLHDTENDEIVKQGQFVEYFR